MERDVKATESLLDELIELATEQQGEALSHGLPDMFKDWAKVTELALRIGERI